MKGTPATALAGLERFAGHMFGNAQGSFTLDEFGYYDDSSLFSFANFAISSNAIAANTFQILFQTPVGSTGQGFSSPLTYADTNVQSGWEGGKPPQNQAYVAIAGGFSVFGVTSASPTGVIPLNVSDLSQVINSVVWEFNVGGNASPTLHYPPIKTMPIGAGVWAVQGRDVDGGASASNGGPVNPMKRFAFPLIFPPNVSTSVTVTFARQCNNLDSNYTNIRIGMCLRGYMLQQIV